MTYDLKNTWDLSNATDMSEMFKDCISLTGINLGVNYTFTVDGKTFTFTRREVDRLQNAISNFKFGNKDPARLRKIADCYIRKFHPEDLL